MAIKGSSQLVIITGALARPPEMRYTPSGQAVTTFSIPVNRQWTDQASGEKKKETIWFVVTTWGKRAETCNTYLKKGSLVKVEGRLKPDERGGPRIWTRQDGTPGSSFELTASDVTFLHVETDGPAPQDEASETPFDPEDEVPF